MLLLVPAGAEPELDPAAGHLVDVGDGDRQHAREAERRRRDERPEADRRRVAGEPGQRDPRIGRAGQPAGLEGLTHRQVVVAAEEGAEAELLGALGDGEQLVVGRALLRLGEDAELAEVEHVSRGYERGYGRRHAGARPPTAAAGSGRAARPRAGALGQARRLHAEVRATSNWFLDTKQTACRPDGILLVADAALEIIPDDATAIGGLTVGADPVAYGVAAVAATRGRQLRSFTVRKEAKDHGIVGRIAGALQPGDRVVITEDTVTRGTSLFEAVDVVRAFGAEPVLITVIVDRGGTCAALAAEAGIAYAPLLTAADLGFEPGD